MVEDEVYTPEFEKFRRAEEIVGEDYLDQLSVTRSFAIGGRS